MSFQIERSGRLFASTRRRGGPDVEEMDVRRVVRGLGASRRGTASPRLGDRRRRGQDPVIDTRARGLYRCRPEMASHLPERALRRLEALLAVADKSTSLVITGNGDVIEPEDNLIAIGSGGPFAQAAARALLDNTELEARTIVEKGLGIAGDICIYTNHNRTIEQLDF